MKKFLAIMLGIACAVGVAVCATSCMDDGSVSYEGSYLYDDQYSDSTPKTQYGVIATVKVKDGKIISVTVAEDTATRYNYTPSWQENTTSGDLGAQKAKEAVPAYLKVYEGKSVAEVKGLTVATLADGTPDKSQSSAWSGYVLTGATQTSGRILLAVQDALKNVN